MSKSLIIYLIMVYLVLFLGVAFENATHKNASKLTWFFVFIIYPVYFPLHCAYHMFKLWKKN